MKTIKIDTMAGTHINEATREAKALAKQKKCMVSFTFNGVKLIATPKKSVQTLRWEFDDTMARQSNAYRQSKAYKKQVAERAEQLEKAQARINDLRSTLDEVLASKDMDKLMEWIHDYAEVADDTGLKIGKATVLRKLLAAGYEKNWGLSQPAEFYDNRENMGRYILGQVIECMTGGMPPHPVSCSFVEKYRKLPPVEPVVPAAPVAA